MNFIRQRRTGRLHIVDMETFASFDGVKIAYTVAGAGPDALLMHGFASNAQNNWFGPGVADKIIASGRRVIAYDARGHGVSDKPHDPSAYDNDAMVRDAQALLDHLGVERIDVLGYSMGAIQASRLVPQEPRARSLVLGGIGGRMRRGRSDASRQATADALEAPPGEAAGDATARDFRTFAERVGNDLRALAAMQRIARQGKPGMIDQIAVPTLVIAGERDDLAGSPDELAARIPGAVAKTIPGNHLSAVSKPEFAAEIVAFLARVSPV